MGERSENKIVGLEEFFLQWFEAVRTYLQEEQGKSLVITNDCIPRQSRKISDFRLELASTFIQLDIHNDVQKQTWNFSSNPLTLKKNNLSIGLENLGLSQEKIKTVLATLEKHQSGMGIMPRTP